MTQIERLGDWIDLAPWKSRTLLLIDLDAMNQEHTIAGKRAMLNDSSRVLAVWPGQWSTSARRLNKADMRRVARVLG